MCFMEERGGDCLAQSSYEAGLLKPLILHIEDGLLNLPTSRVRIIRPYQFNQDSLETTIDIH